MNLRRLRRWFGVDTSPHTVGDLIGNAPSLLGVPSYVAAGAFYGLSGTYTVAQAAVILQTWLGSNANTTLIPLTKQMADGLYAAIGSASGGVADTPVVSKLLVCGHSIPAGQNEQASGTGNNWPSVVAKMIGAALTNVAVGGSALCTDNAANRANAFWTTSGGWITCFAQNIINRSGLTDFSGNITSPLQAVCIMHSYNDLGVIGPPGQSLANKAAKGGVYDTTFPPAMHAVIRHLRAGHTGYVWNGTDSGSAQRGLIVLDANWTKTTGTSVSSTGFVAFPSTTSAGATATLTLPSWYPGGLAVDLNFVGSLNNQGSFNVSVDGTFIGVADGTQILATSDAGTREQTVYSFRIPGSALAAAGSHTITVVFNGGTGQPYFDSWSIEASTPPLVVLVKMYQMLADQSPSGNLDGTGAANYGVKNTDIIASNAGLDAIAASYSDGRVITVDTDSLIQRNPALLQINADNIHPSINGAAMIGNAVAQAIRAYYSAHPLDLAQTGKG